VPNERPVVRLRATNDASPQQISQTNSWWTQWRSSLIQSETRLRIGFHEQT